jgi:hypothetical protein
LIKLAKTIESEGIIPANSNVKWMKFFFVEDDNPLVIKYEEDLKL